MGNSAILAMHEFEESRTKRSSFCAVISTQSCFGSTAFDKGEFAIHKQVGIPRGRISPDAMHYLTSTEAHLLLASAQQNVELLRDILSKGAKVDTYDENRTSPLHIACRHGSPEIVQTLMDFGASVNITDCAGWSPLHVASYCRKADIVKILLQREADPTICNARGETPWDIASDQQTQTVFKEFYRDSDERQGAATPLNTSARKPAKEGRAYEGDGYIPGPLNLSALESSVVHETMFPGARRLFDYSAEPMSDSKVEEDKTEEDLRQAY